MRVLGHVRRCWWSLFYFLIPYKIITAEKLTLGGWPRMRPHHTHTQDAIRVFLVLEIILAAIREIDGDIRLGVRDQSNRFSNM